MTGRPRPPLPAPSRIGPSTFRWGERTFVMGILNVTPDSFSGDGLLAETRELRHQRRLPAKTRPSPQVGPASAFASNSGPAVSTHAPSK